MALDPNALANSLSALSRPGGHPKSRAAAARAWAQAYQQYASAGQAAGVGPPGSLANAEATLRTALEAAFGAGMGGAPPQTVATAIAVAVTAFWLSPPVMFSGIRGGSLVSLVPGTPACAATLGATFTARSPEAMADIADALHALTKTVQVFSPLPAPPITVGLV